ncbi:MAG: hypothetical protein ACI4R7_00735, partial [Oliverpabstia sp.]
SVTDSEVNKRFSMFFSFSFLDAFLPGFIFFRTGIEKLYASVQKVFSYAAKEKSAQGGLNI